ncbi:hypothetical protein BH11MYX3_BH11MYX3_21470 [soil metagenome]
MVILERLSSATHPQVVRVRVRSEQPNFDAPWSRTPRETEGIAVLVGPRLLVTLASAVVHAVEQPPGANQVLARIVAIDHDRDLALLEVAEPWSIEPVALAPLPAECETVVLVGLADERIDVGTARIAEVGLVRYVHSQRHLIAVTVEARQPFHAGGDAVFGKHGLVGLVMQRSNADELRGEVVPTPMIRAFLDGVEAGKPPGVQALGVDVQALKNPLMRTQRGETGVVVTRIDLEGTCDGILQPRDVLLSIDGVPIDDDGNVMLEGRALRHYAVLGTRHIGDSIELGTSAGIKQVTLRPWLPLVPHGNCEPRYLIYAGLVFQPLTRDFLATWDSWWNDAPKELLHAYYVGRRTVARREIIVLSSILEDPINLGYQHLVDESIVRIGDRAPQDFAEFVRLLDAARGDILIETSSGGLIALDSDEVRQGDLTDRASRRNLPRP